MDERARVLGAAFRVAHLISAARPGVLPAHPLPQPCGRKLMLVFEHKMVDLVADRVGSRFKQLARLGRPLRIDRAALEHDEFTSRLKLAWPDNKNIENNPMQSNRRAATSRSEVARYRKDTAESLSRFEFTKKQR